MSGPPPFSPDGFKKLQLRWSGHEDAGSMWSQMSHEAVGDDAGTFQIDGDHYNSVAVARPVGRVVIRTIEYKHGLAQYLSSDSPFTRYTDGYVYLQDRKALDPIVVPQVLSGQPIVTASGTVSAGFDGRRPYTYPFADGDEVDLEPLSQQIVMMGPAERKLQSPYGITVRGSSFGFSNVLNDNFFFPEDHHHITDHRGPAPIDPKTGGPRDKPDDRRSTRWYDVDQGGQPSIDYIDFSGIPHRGFNQKSDRIIVVHRDADGCAGGDADDMNLAFNFSGRTGFAFGLCEMRAEPTPFVPPAEPKEEGRGSVAPDGQKKQEGSIEPPPTTGVDAVLATLAYERGGFCTAGHTANDKHRYGRTKFVAGEPQINYHPMHIHINGKFTNESEIFDGRRNMNPVFEPPIGVGLLPVRCYEQWNPNLSDPYFCGDKKGGWDFHTRVPSCPIYDEPQAKDTDEPQAKDTDEPQAKDTDEPQAKIAPPTSPLKLPPDDGGSSDTSEPDDRTDPKIDGDAKDDGGVVSDRKEAASDWGPTETVRPSAEQQPRPGNTESPTSGHGNVPKIGDPDGDGISHGTSAGGYHGTDSIEDILARAEAGMLVHVNGLTDMDLVTVPITGVPFTDYMLAPKTLHQIAYYKHKYDSPRDNEKRALRRNPPEYTVRAKYKEGDSISFPKQHTWGTAAGATLYAPIELKSHQARHDYSGKIEALSPQSIVHYPGVKLEFGYLNDTWDKVANGFSIYQGTHPDGTINKGLLFDGVDDAGVSDPTRAYQFIIPVHDKNGDEILGGGGVSFPLLAPDGDTLAPSYSFVSSPASGMFYDPAGADPDRISFNAPDGSTKIFIDANGVTIDGKLSMNGIIDPPTGVEYDPQAVNPNIAVGGVLANTTWIDSGVSRLKVGSNTLAYLSEVAVAGDPAEQVLTVPAAISTASKIMHIFLDVDTVGNFSVTLPAISDAETSQYHFILVGTGQVTITAAGIDELVGVATGSFTLMTGEVLILRANATLGWW